MKISLKWLLLVLTPCLFLHLFLTANKAIGQTQADSTWSYNSIRTDIDGDGVPDFLGEKVIVTGIVNAASGLFHEQYLQTFIQNDTSGISIFAYNIDKPIVAGDSIKAWGFIDTYNGLVEVQVDSFQIIKKTELHAPLPLESAIKSPAKYLGVLAEGDGIIIDKGTTFNGKYLVITQPGQTGSIMVYVSNFHTRFSGFNFKVLNIGDEIAVKGTITEYNPEVPDEKNYKIFLRTPSDLSYIGLPGYYVRMIIWVVLGVVGLLAVIYLFLQYRIKTKTKQIQLSLKQRELLLKEIHHRVKNSLSIVSSLIEMQSMQTDNQETNQILHNSQSRIQSIALIHDKLYKTEALNEINLDVYIQDLVESIHKTFTAVNERVNLNFDLDPVQIDSEQVIYFGLLINELVVNSYKHAFNNQDKGELKVSLKKENNHISLTVSDNGPGLPKKFDPSDDESLGSMLINTFAANLKAKMNISAPKGDGTSFTFTIPHKLKQ